MNHPYNCMGCFWRCKVSVACSWRYAWISLWYALDLLLFLNSGSMRRLELSPSTQLPFLRDDLIYHWQGSILVSYFITHWKTAIRGLESLTKPCNIARTFWFVLSGLLKESRLEFYTASTNQWYAGNTCLENKNSCFCIHESSISINWICRHLETKSIGEPVLLCNQFLFTPDHLQ